MKWRVKYWRWINEYAGEWYRTGLMTKESAPACGSTLRIETDTEKSLKESKEKFEREHKDCKK